MPPTARISVESGHTTVSRAERPPGNHDEFRIVEELYGFDFSAFVWLLTVKRSMITLLLSHAIA
jgi:hypothetical protein